MTILQHYVLNLVQPNLLLLEPMFLAFDGFFVNMQTVGINNLASTPQDNVNLVIKMKIFLDQYLFLLGDLF